MKVFKCSACGNRVYFESATCLKCGHPLGFDPDALQMVAVELVGNETSLYRKLDLNTPRPNGNAPRPNSPAPAAPPNPVPANAPMPVAQQPGNQNLGHQNLANSSLKNAGAPTAQIRNIPPNTAAAPVSGNAKPAVTQNAPLVEPEAGLVHFCENASYGACNWLVPQEAESRLCKSCALNRTIPNLSEEGRLAAWREIEQAKKRLIYSLLRFGLPLDGGPGGNQVLTFDVVSRAITGHFDGVITLDVLEADHVERERRRQNLDEPYRSVLGHLRHESGHYYWMLLVDRDGVIEEFRSVFGDERQNYQAALSAHYANGAVPNWSENHVSAYASCHPWEDWAETWAHYLHIVDAVETAEVEGMEPRAAGLLFGAAWPFERYDVYTQVSFDALMERWIPLSLAMNNISRSLGHRDFYPFVISQAGRGKLAFVHRLVREH